jgi:hypothetical protein
MRGIGVQGEACAALHARCRAEWGVAREKWTCAHLGTPMPRPGRARTQAEHGLARAPRSARAAAGHWVTKAVSPGVHWRGCRGWLAVDACVPSGVLLVSVSVRVGEG